MPGIIALEHSPAWNRDNKPIVSVLESEAHEMLARQRCTSFFDKHKKQINEVVAGCGVVGIVVFNFYVRHRSDREWELAGVNLWFDTSDGDRQAKYYHDLLYRHFNSAMPNMAFMR
jgi:hypothetical protein